jgi:hypothetical protein
MNCTTRPAVAVEHFNAFNSARTIESMTESEARAALMIVTEPYSVYALQRRIYDLARQALPRPPALATSPIPMPADLLAKFSPALQAALRAKQPA